MLEGSIGNTERHLGQGPSSPEVTEHFKVAIIGSGFSGIGMAIRLIQRGMRDFVILEREDQVGGTWYLNSYPGAACDVPSRLYSFSFEQNPSWSRSFSPQGEIFEYLKTCTSKYGIGDHIRFRCDVEEAVWDDDSQAWDITTPRGRFRADVLVSAAGALCEPKSPSIPGIERFKGTIFHSAAWNHQHDVSGEKVAVVGTGASAIQVVPSIQPIVEHLDLYQRTPPWIIPRNDRKFGRLERVLSKRVPLFMSLTRALIYWTREFSVVALTRHLGLLGIEQKIAYRHLKSQVADPELRRKLTPSYTIGCKRILISNDYYPALTQSNATLVTDSIAEIGEDSIVTSSGETRPTDTIIFATGFQTLPLPIGERIRGRDGHSLGEIWSKDGVEGYKGTTFSGFPNLFMIVGPNTGLGHTSMVYMIESQINYVLGALDAMGREGITALYPKERAQETYNRDLQSKLQGTVWQQGGCDSWYQDENGKNTSLWPDFTFRFRKQLRRFDVENYEYKPTVRPNAGKLGANAGAEVSGKQSDSSGSAETLLSL